MIGKGEGGFGTGSVGEGVKQRDGVAPGQGGKKGGLGPALGFEQHVAGGAAAVVADAGEPEGSGVAGVGFPLAGVLGHGHGVNVGADGGQGDANHLAAI